MKKLSILLYFFLLSLCTFAQEVLYEETFDMKNEAWVSTDSSAVEEYKNGKLLLHGQPGEKAVAVLREVILDPLKDFSIRCRITYDHGDTENSFGMVLVDDRFTGKSSWYYLMVYPRDYYRVSCSKGINLELNDYLPKQKKAGIMRASGEYNDLELRNAGDVFEFYINDQKVWRKEYPDICITRIGLFSEGDQEIQVDDLVIKQNGWNSIHLVDDSLKSYKKENLGENINSTASELLPIISADGQTLYLCVDGDTNNIGINYKQDIWYSTLNPDKTWSKRVNMGFPLNNESPNGVCYVSPDNNTLLLNGLYDATGKTIGPGISLSNRQKTGWSIPVALNIDNYYNHNTYVSVAYAPSGKTLIMAIEREDTFGDLDLYVSMKKDDGSWWEPRNMGPDINTFGSECTPYLAADNTTLYFATNARPGFGGHDLFMTRRLDDTWAAWSEPENLGPNINTPRWDAYFTIPASGEYCYLVSTDNSLGREDIFRTKVSEAAKPNPVALIKGLVYKNNTSEFLEADITYFDLETNQVIGTARSNPVNGTYQISLPAGHKYSYNAKRDEFFSVSENIDLLDMQVYAEITRNLYLAPVEVGTGPILLNNIFFEFDKSELLDESVYELDRLVKLMNEYPKMVIQIAGHTDNFGTDAYNQKLSEDRARAVFLYLKDKGLGTRISSIGYGKSKPVETNDTDEGRKPNRRVEFVIIEK